MVPQVLHPLVSNVRLRRWVGRSGRQLLDELDLDGGGLLLGLRLNGEGAAEGAVEEGDVNDEGNAVVVVAGDAVVSKEEVFVELGDGLDAVAIEEVVEEDGVGFCEVQVAGAPDLVQRWEKPW